MRSLMFQKCTIHLPLYICLFIQTYESNNPDLHLVVAFKFRYNYLLHSTTTLKLSAVVFQLEKHNQQISSPWDPFHLSASASMRTQAIGSADK